LRAALSRTDSFAASTVLFSAVLLGAATVLAFAPFGFFSLAIVAPALLMLSWRAATPKQAALTGFLFGMGLFGFGVSWVYVSLHNYGEMPAPLAALATFLFCAVLACFPALVGFVQAKFALPPLARYVAFVPALWALSEWVRGWLLTGFPWLALGYSQTPPSPLAGYAPVLGVYGISLLVMMSAGVLAFLFTKGIRKEPSSLIPHPSSLSFILHPSSFRFTPHSSSLKFVLHPSLLLLVALWLGGFGLRQIEWTQPVGEAVGVSLLQGNVAQEIKWEPAQIQHTLVLYRELALQSDTPLIIFPETALPLFYHQVPDSYTDELAEHANRNKGAMLIGVPEYVAGKDELYNSVVTADGKQRYRKVHLVPFGEFIPPGFDWVLEILHIPLSDFSRGSADQKPIEAAGQKIAVNVCYEDAFGEEIIRQLPEATLLVNVSNVAWFGRSIAPWQHAQISRMRAIETGRYMLRATNSGVTAIIAPDGEVVKSAPVFEQRVVVGNVRGYSGATPYVRFGNSLMLVIAGLLLACAVWPRFRRRETK
jgi:apolipoprotein N-acyltransferase